ncbi:hypothetical protein [Lactococcus kimchii]|uniref:hypothetical protein n=1 Tax=Lactococcus sp. S-13 TaxID=2507158 RepID=UPI001023034B|nr:hypothetical protein [Lactococcus sp. S-13]RZI49630.1 hypothetical protein EQJ87_09450 [Lactococcus sp. S-13]
MSIFFGTLLDALVNFGNSDGDTTSALMKTGIHMMITAALNAALDGTIIGIPAAWLVSAAANSLFDFLWDKYIYPAMKRRAKEE